MFRVLAVADQPLRKRAEEAAAKYAQEIVGPVRSERVIVVVGNVAFMVQVWDARACMPTSAELSRPATVGDPRDLCRTDILEVMQAHSGPQTRKAIVRLLKEAGRLHGPSTVAKALAELTRAGELVNPQDKKGYRLKGWRKDNRPSLF